MTDLELETSPVFNYDTDIDLVNQLLDQLLSKAHPLLAEAIFLSAVPFRFDADLLTALRHSDDGRDARIVNRLSRISFIKPLIRPDVPEGSYQVNPLERDLLNKRFMIEDPDMLVAAHQRVLDYLDEHPLADHVMHEQYRLYHMLFVDIEAAIELLSRAFREYVSARRLAAAENLLAVAGAAIDNLEFFDAPQLADLRVWLQYLKSRLAAFYGRWDAASQSFADLLAHKDMPASLRPYVARAYGLSLANGGQYVEAIAQYNDALQAFHTTGEIAEEGFTMINLGDAYVGLAVAARGEREVIPMPRQETGFRLSDIPALLVGLPLLAYASLFFGNYVWMPRAARNLVSEDWVIVRLFGNAVRWFRRAEDLLGTLDRNHPDRLQAREKQAELFLTLGDSPQALPMLEAMLERHGDTMGEYRKARAFVQLARAYLPEGRCAAAESLLTEQLPIINAYQDNRLEAVALGLLAESRYQTGKYEQAITEFSHSIEQHQNLGDFSGANEISQRLYKMRHDDALKPQERALATMTGAGVRERHYLLRFQHPAMEGFRRTGLVLAAIFILLLPMFATSVNQLSSVTPTVGFVAAPPLLASSGLSQLLTLDVAPAFETSVAPSFSAGVAGIIVLQVLVLLAVLYWALGVFLLARTPLSTVQASQAKAIRIDLQQIASGVGDDLVEIDWTEITHVVSANRRLFGRLAASQSFTMVSTPDKRIVVGGNSAYYHEIADRTRRFAPDGIRYTNLDYNVGGGMLGWVYYGAIAILLLVIGAFAVGGQGLQLGAASITSLADGVTSPLFGTIYSVSDLYPFIYLGLFLPPLYWLLLHPMRVRVMRVPKDWLMWLFIGLSLFVGGMRFFVPSFRLPVTPDIYTLLAAMLIGGWAAVLQMTARSPWPADVFRSEQSKHVYSLPVRAFLGAVLLVLVLPLGWRLVQTVQVYHLSVLGHSLRDAAWEQTDRAYSNALVRQSLAVYDRALQIEPRNIDLLNNRAATYTQLARYEDAVADFGVAMDIGHEALRENQAVLGLLHANRAVSYEGWSLYYRNEGDDNAADTRFENAVEDFDLAIKLDPENGFYYFWRGIANHVLGNLPAALADYDTARQLDVVSSDLFMARGWVFFQTAAGFAAEDDEAQAEKFYQDALEQFIAAELAEPDNADIWLAIGYANFQLDNYDETISAWERAVHLNPDDPVPHISLGTGHWAYASDPNYCRDDEATDQQRQFSINQFEFALQNINRALEINREDDFSYRTRAQIQYALGGCDPEYDFGEQQALAIDSYTQALTYAPDVDLYWQFRARLLVSQATDEFARGDAYEDMARDMLQQATADIDQALALNPDDTLNGIWHEFITESGWAYVHMKRGDVRLAADELGAAVSDYTTAIDLFPPDAGDRTEAMLSLARAYLRVGDVQLAASTLDEAVTRAVELGHGYQLGQEINRMTALLAQRPGLTDTGERFINAMKSGRGDIFLAAAEAAFANEDYDGAVASAQAAVTNYPGNTEGGTRAAFLLVRAAVFAGVDTAEIDGYLADALERARFNNQTDILVAAAEQLRADAEADPMIQPLREQYIADIEATLAQMP